MHHYRLSGGEADWRFFRACAFLPMGADGITIITSSIHETLKVAAVALIEGTNAAQPWL